MGLSYLDGQTWNQVSREERYFVLELYNQVAAHVPRFIRFLNRAAKLDLEPDASWDVGFEVCFYRDYLKFKGQNVRATDYSDKRTFDLALFSEDRIVVIEAKCQQGFKTDQVCTFDQDRRDIPAVLGRPIGVTLVSFASSRYYANEAKYGRAGVLDGFDGRCSWDQLYTEYQVEAFRTADALYGD